MLSEPKERNNMSVEGTIVSTNFIQAIINEDNKTGAYGQQVHTRFPPEPNGYLHIGHAKSICLNFGLAKEYSGLCNLRFDDTNPSKEETEYVDSIQEDVQWLGFQWHDKPYYASDYFETLYQYAHKLIALGKAYVCDLTPQEMREYRGTLTESGKESPYRNRSPKENADLFSRMRQGEFPDGSRVLRAKIDMASPNMNMRDPVLYRIMRAHHHRTGDQWLLYPMYDYAHPLSDAIEEITHSVCTLEFEAHRPLYDWVLEDWDGPTRPKQIEFARLNITNTVMSKRKLRLLVEKGLVSGWDDPRMPTISGLRRRGYTPESLRDFCDRIGVAKSNSTVDIALLEHCIRENLNTVAPRAMAVIDPLKIVLTNYPEGQSEELEAENNPENPDMGVRTIPFSRVLYIEQDDFMENPPKKYFRLSPGNEVRLKHAYIIKCEEVVKDSTGQVVELRCTYDRDTKSGSGTANRKVKGVIHWVSADRAVDAEVRLYDYLMVDEGTAESDGEDFIAKLNPKSLVTCSGKVEPSLAQVPAGDKYQFLRQGFFCADRDSLPGKPVFNRIVGLRDSWAKTQKEG